MRTAVRSASAYSRKVPFFFCLIFVCGGICVDIEPPLQVKVEVKA
jgi:hypothetical protein